MLEMIMGYSSIEKAVALAAEFRDQQKEMSHLLSERSENMVIDSVVTTDDDMDTP